MCGIMGLVGVPKDKRAADLSYQLATKLLGETVTRGSHATGVYSLLPPKGDSKKNRVFVYKLDAPSTQFVKTQTWRDMRKDGEPFLLLGHCRFYTHGSPQVHVNNHPHVSDDKKLALIHNGVISGYDGLKKTYEVQGECDSEVLLRIIEDEDDVMEGIKKIFRVVVTGAFSCLVCKYDSNTRIGHFYAFRNEGNPMVVVDLRQQLGQLFIGSTEDIVTKALKNSAMPKRIRKQEIVDVPSYEIWHCTTENQEWEVVPVERTSPGYTTYSSSDWDVRNRRSGGCYGGTDANRQLSGPSSDTAVSTAKRKNIRALLDTIVGSVTEIDEEVTNGNSFGLDDDELEEALKAAAWELEKVVNPALNEEHAAADTEFFD